jgi:hypothetical protein
MFRTVSRKLKRGSMKSTASSSKGSNRPCQIDNIASEPLLLLPLLSQLFSLLLTALGGE